LDYIVRIAEELAGKLQQMDKAALVGILKQYALYHDDIRADLSLRLSPPEDVLGAALQRIRASFEPCRRRGKHSVKYSDVYEALFGASAVLLVAEDDNAGFQPRERLWMCFAVLEEMGRIFNDIDEDGDIEMIVNDAFRHIPLLAARIPATELAGLMKEHLQRGREFYHEWTERKAELLGILGPFLDKKGLDTLGGNLC
jgi:hypothetical protein